MKFLVDECVGSSVAHWLKQNNYDAISIYDVLPGIDDDAVLQKAFSENRILITSDKDFGEMVFKSKKQHCGIILLRLENEKPSHKVLILKNLLEHYQKDLFGNFVVVTANMVRIIRPSLS